MRLGVLCKGEVNDFDWLHRLGFRSLSWIRFFESGCAPEQADWRKRAEQIGAEARARDLRISAIGAIYVNPLDPRQTERVRLIFRRAIEVAALIGVKTVSGLAGAVIETTLNERGGNPVYQPLENFLPQLLGFWEPLAEFAADRDVRLAFENCPHGVYHLPIMGCNAMAQPAMWERFFSATRHENLGLEWDPSHLICQLIDPVPTIHRFGSRIFHVHAKDAYVNRSQLDRYGICHSGVAEHRMPGFGQADWAQIVHALVRAGYDSDLNIEGWHDPVFCDHPETIAENASVNPRLATRKLEDAGLLVAKRTLEPLVAGTEVTKRRQRGDATLPAHSKTDRKQGTRKSQARNRTSSQKEIFWTR